MTTSETAAQARRRLAREQREREACERRAAYIAAVLATMPPLTEDECIAMRELLRPVRGGTAKRGDASTREQCRDVA